MVDAVGIEPTTCRLRADDQGPEYLCFQWSTEDNLVRNGALSALVWTKFWSKPPQPMTKPKNRVPPGSFYLIVEKSAQFGDRFDLNE